MPAAKQLDRYLLREWSRIFLVTTIGFPMIVSVIELTDKLGGYLTRGLTVSDILLGYLAGIPESVFLVSRGPR